MDDCVFCGIIRGELPASVVYQDPECVAIMDIHPMRPGHVLVLSRRHAVHLHELSEQEQQCVFLAATRVSVAQRESGLPWEAGSLVVNDGPAAGQHVPHVHVHVVPRTRGDRMSVLRRLLARNLDFFGRSVDRPELDALAERIRSHLPRGGRPPS